MISCWPVGGRTHPAGPAPAPADPLGHGGAGLPAPHPVGLLRTGALPMSLGMAAYALLQAILAWQCFRAVGSTFTVPEVFAGFAFGRLLTSVVVTPSGVGISETGRRGAADRSSAATRPPRPRACCCSACSRTSSRSRSAPSAGSPGRCAPRGDVRCRRWAIPRAELAPDRLRGRLTGPTWSGRVGGQPVDRTRSRLRRQPGDGLVAAEPRSLAAHVPAGRGHRGVAGLAFGSAAGQHAQHLRVAQRPGRGPSLVACPSASSRVDLLDQPSVPHPVHAGAIRASSSVAVGRQPDPQPVSGRPRAVRGASSGRTAWNGRPVISTTSRARTTLRPLLGSDRRGGRRVRRRPAVRAGPGAASAELGLRAGRVRRDRFREVEPSSTARRTAPSRRPARGQRHGPGSASTATSAPLVGRDAGVLVHVQDVQEVMRDAVPFVDGSLAVPMSMPR